MTGQPPDDNSPPNGPSIGPPKDEPQAPPPGSAASGDARPAAAPVPSGPAAEETLQRPPLPESPKNDTDAREVLNLYAQSIPGRADEPNEPGEPGETPRWLRRLALACCVAVYLAILATAGAIRTYRMDMPPFDYPEARQMWNVYLAKRLMDGASIFDARHGWVELQIHPFLYARTAWIADRLGWELWTWGRFWSILCGTLTVALAPLAMWWAPAPGTRRTRRWRLALLFMAAMAFNPYHVYMSRMLITEPLTLMLQMTTLIFFWRYYRDSGRYGSLALFFLFLILSGWAKIPSLIWMPGFLLYLLFRPGIGWIRRASVIGLVSVCGLAVLWLYGLNPFKIFSRFAEDYPIWTQQFLDWKGNVLWYRTYLGKNLLMMTVPGLVFAAIGLLSAPLLFPLAAAAFLVLFYGLVSQNTYNFCHLIVPTMAMAAWGVDYLLETSTRWYLRQDTGAPGAPPSCLGRLAYAVHQTAAVAFVLAIVFLLYSLSPQPPHEVLPRGEVLNAVEAVKRILPADVLITNDDTERCFTFMLDRGNMPLSRTFKLDKGGYFLTFGRYAYAETIKDVARAWVLWASVPGEFGGILYANSGGRIADLPQAEYVSMRLPSERSTPFALNEAFLPIELIDPENERIVMHPGESLRMGVRWRNSRRAPVVFMGWQHQQLEDYIPPPVREGGIAVYSGATLCLPAGSSSEAIYTFDLPAGFPTGAYSIVYYPIYDLSLSEEVESIERFPLKLVVEPAPDAVAAAAAPIRRRFAELYPQLLDRSPNLWSDDWFYEDMRIEGFTFNRNVRWIFSTPGRPAGRYALRLRGSSYPLTRADNADLDWANVEVTLVGSKKSPVGKIGLTSRETDDHELTFTAPESFDNIVLGVDIRIANNGQIPALPTEFIIRDYGTRLGQQFALLRGVELIPLAGSASSP
jgi:hypothetical protein